MIQMRQPHLLLLLASSALAVGCGPTTRAPAPVVAESAEPATASPAEILAAVTQVEPEGNRLRVTLDKGNEQGVHRRLLGCVVRDGSCATTATLIRIDKTESVVVVDGGADAVRSGDVIRLYQAK
jgi:hypothetical protein